MYQRATSTFFNEVIESSAVAGAIRRVAAGSLLLGIVRALGRSLWRVEHRIACAAEADPATDAAHLAAMGRQSLLIRWLERAVGAADVTWRRSRVRTLGQAVRQVVAALPLSRRVLLLGWMVAVAAAARGALALGGMPMTPLALSVSIVVFCSGVVMMAVNGQLAAAWSEAARRRARRR
jgi:hypothetical protein